MTYRSKPTRRMRSFQLILITRLYTLKRLMQGHICILYELAEDIGPLEDMRVTKLNGCGLEVTKTTIISDY